MFSGLFFKNPGEIRDNLKSVEVLEKIQNPGSLLMNPGELATMKMTLNLYPVHWRKQRLSYLKMEIPLHLSSDIFR